MTCTDVVLRFFISAVWGTTLKWVSVINVAAMARHADAGVGVTLEFGEDGPFTIWGHTLCLVCSPMVEIRPLYSTSNALVGTRLQSKNVFPKL